jgi:hypothetical protein
MLTTLNMSLNDYNVCVVQATLASASLMTPHSCLSVL